MPPPPPPLPVELLDEIFLRVPPDEPGCLFRASLVCKPWRSRLTSAAFSLLYREFHRTPPLLGFFENDERLFFWFTPLSRTSLFPSAHPSHCDFIVLDSRHGLVLLSSVGSSGEPLSLVVWDPVGGRQWDLPYPKFAEWASVPDSAAVLCAVDGCDHLNCHGGQFRVVYVGTSDDDGIARACVYSSEARAWSAATSCEPEHHELPLEVVGNMPKALVGNALYFSCITTTIILRYDLTTQELSMIDRPQMYYRDSYILITMEDGVLGCASLQKSRLDLWSMEAGQEGSVRWALRRRVKLESVLPCCSMTLINSADTLGVFFARTRCGVFTIEGRSGRVKKVSGSNDYVIPYESFYTPGGLTPPSTMASLEETVEVAQDEQYDSLLSHLSDEESEEEDWGWKQEKASDELFNKGSMAIEKGRFVDAKEYFREALETRVLLYGRFSPKCLSTYFKYGCALLYAQPMSAPNQDLWTDITNKHATGKEEEASTLSLPGFDSSASQDTSSS